MRNQIIRNGPPAWLRAERDTPTWELQRDAAENRKPTGESVTWNGQIDALATVAVADSTDSRRSESQ